MARHALQVERGIAADQKSLSILSQIVKSLENIAGALAQRYGGQRIPLWITVSSRVSSLLPC